ncbi:succinate dehydrogenase (ubiquinone) membrane anchor subunit [Wickerhamomyces ciferrii]|uniref:Succinate dehydrogenase [ubiquinone] cytochrome b small subunit n=1 Tax=Wickerhamomyces ciferrii (strain ATCC 14091 / BCRC 22168 / CBS 111 / JCM 3599 / NBRC 0793 / NRRL Y-1031 F-60-10) TaxID=1206466 RepID=K0KH21_WICCF|nr:succinate dehydrogenase (ubiquinone) membrane anchor subunit [Wickerhamomyces ciferrii]CCH42261.1 succinate dehydrogenase (ubiquinone) membrane anchor subunit [Wickerhamomyces ciferrii]
MLRLQPGIIRPALRFPTAGLAKRTISLKPDFNKYKLIEQPAGYIVGTVNEATPQAEINYFHGSYHWSYERLLAVALVPLATTPFISQVDFPILDALLATSVLVHSHIGFTSCIIDYIPKRVYGIWHKFARYLLTLGTTVGLYGIYQMETTDVGLTNLIKKIWKNPN